MMRRSLVIFFKTIVLALGSNLVVAGNGAEDLATVVVYRDDDSSRTKHVQFYIYGGERLAGRVKAGKQLTFTVPAGEFMLSTNLPGAPTETLFVEPGSVHHVRSALSLYGTHLDLDLEEISGQELSPGA